MATTIQVQETIVTRLKQIKNSRKFASYNDAIDYLIHRETTRKSFWGAGKKKMTMLQILEGLRDETNRF